VYAITPTSPPEEALLLNFKNVMLALS